MKKYFIKQELESLFCSYEQALALKELGFDEPCFGYYVGLGDNKEDPFKLVQIQSEKGQFEWIDNVYHAPTYSQVFRWFREKQYYSEITTECTQVDGSIGFSWRIWKPWLIEEWSPENGNDEWSYKTYEEAELTCLNKLIEICKNEQ
jgi:hypothetical protein